MARHVLAQAIGIETRGGEFTPLLQKGAALPVRTTMTFSTAEDNQKLVHVKLYQGFHEKAQFNRQICGFDVTDLPPAPQGAPQIEVSVEVDEHGALKAAARDVESGRSHNVRFDQQAAGIDIDNLDAPGERTPRLAAAIGIETLGGVFTPILGAGMRLPASVSDVFSTAEDNQNTVSIKLYQGLNESAADNRALGAFDLAGLPPAPQGVPKIEVKFALDAQGVLTVAARDQATGKEQRVVMSGADAKADIQWADPAADFAEFRDIFQDLFGQGAKPNSTPAPQTAASRAVFVSHASPDAPLASDLVQQLESAGRSCWIAPRDVRAGADYRAEIVAALKGATHLVAFISEASNHSPHVLREIALAEQYGKRVVPIRVDDVELRSELEYMLQGVHWVRVDGAAAALSKIL